MTTADLIATGLPIDVRTPDADLDSIDGVVPGMILEPRTAEGVAATLAWASAQRLSVLIRGAGTKRAWGRPPTRVDVVLSMRGLNRVLSHQHGDLTVSVEAGTTLFELNQSLAAGRQWLPLDPPFDDRATIGGLLATNDSGPARHRFGTPRDLVIGVQVATTDGRLTRSGGGVVKNVAGYDLSKLMSGSFGHLAAIVGAIFKLSPVPGAAATVVVSDLDADSLQRVIEAMFASQLEPVAFELTMHQSRSRSPVMTCLLRFASLPDAVRAAVTEARSSLAAMSTSIVELTGEAEWRRWHEHKSGLWQRPGAIVRMSWLPANWPAVAELLKTVRIENLELIGRVVSGAGVIRLEGDVAGQAHAIEQLRASPVVGNVVVLRADVSLKAQVDVWGPVANRALIEEIKRELDPNATLGANRGPL